MIFIKPEDNQSIWISKHNLAKEPYILKLTHNLTQKETEFVNLTDAGQNSGYHIFYGLDFRSLESGEYTYSLLDDSGYQKETGLIQVMSILKDPITYKKQSEKIIYSK